MRLGESILRCYECRLTASYEEVEIVTRNGKRYWGCPSCGMETLIVEWEYPFPGRKFKKRRK